MNPELDLSKLQAGEPFDSFLIEFLFGIAHEIKIPLAFKNSLTATLVDSTPPPSRSGGGEHSSEIWVEVSCGSLKPDHV